MWVCGCAWVCTHMCMGVNIYTHTHTSMGAHTHTCVFMYVHISNSECHNKLNFYMVSNLSLAGHI